MMDLDQGQEVIMEVMEDGIMDMGGITGGQVIYILENLFLILT